MKSKSTRLKWLLILLILAGLGSALLGRRAQEQVFIRLALWSKAPNAAAVQAFLEDTKNPAAWLQRFWNEPKIPHRRLVVDFLSQHDEITQRYRSALEPLLIAAALGVDGDLRELALNVLSHLEASPLSEVARAQLSDADADCRILGLQYLRIKRDTLYTPIAMRMLDDADERVAVYAVSLLRALHGTNFGTNVPAPATDLPEDQTGDRPSTKAALLRKREMAKMEWRQWWAGHQSEFNNALTTNRFALDTLRPPAPDFALPDLRGERVHLSAYRGKVVVLNFWATWCSPCLAEIPDLIALQNQYGDRLRLIGISLDNPAMDPHGRREAAVQPKLDMPALREKVSRTVQRMGIPYPVLLDPEQAVGQCFSARELPTTLLIDAQGNLVRRLVGNRPLRGWQEMIDQALKPQL